MEVEFLSRFLKDLDEVNQPKIRKSIRRIIEKVEQAKTLGAIHNCKKLAGHSVAYRIRVGDFRIGIFVMGNRIQFARVVHRKDIYKIFP